MGLGISVLRPVEGSSNKTDNKSAVLLMCISVLQLLANGS